MTTAADRWTESVEAHQDQSKKIQIESDWPQGDLADTLLPRLKDDPRRTGDMVLDRLDLEVGSNTSVLDVGGGAGKYALPLALRSRSVKVVEPSTAMGEVLEAEAKRARIENISVVKGLWEDVEVEPAQVVLCASVVYGITDLKPFILKLESHATDRVLILACMEPSQSIFSSVWEAVHEEGRNNLPGISELLSALWELEIYPDVEMFEPTAGETVPNRETALQYLRQMLYVQPDTEKDQRLQALMDDLVVQTPDGLTIQGARPKRQVLISWRPRKN